jgi:sulfhydrogenase subunit alpha
MKKITLDHITKIEGHAKLHIQVKDNKIKKCELQIFEGSRYFEGILKGKHYTDLPDITSRICGVCSVAHTLASIKAIEAAFNVKVSEQTKLLRELLIIGGILQSHAMHLYFLVLPDYFGCGSALQLAKKEPILVKRALLIKRTCNNLVATIAARDVHPISAIPGGFTRLPEQSKLNTLIKDLRLIRSDAEQTVKLFKELEYPEFEKQSDKFALTGSSYFYSDKIISCKGNLCIPTNDYELHFKEYFKSGSTAEFSRRKGKSYMVGALARTTVNKNLLLTCKNEVISLNENNPYHNNVAQAIEICEGLNQAIRILENIKLKEEEVKEIIPKSNTGVGALEAPRGILFHKYKFNKKGICKFANITTPTTQNLPHLEEAIKQLVPTILDRKEEEIKLEIEKLIRAYDPCISCSTHFLELKLERT